MGIFLVQEKEKIIFKYVSSDFGYEGLEKEDKEKMEPAIALFRVLEKME